MMKSQSQKRHQPMKRQQRGNAVLFSLLGLVIGGVVLSAGINFYQDSERAASIQEVTGQVNTIIGMAKQNYGQYAFTGLTTAIAVGSRAIPNSMANSATTAVNKFSGAVDLVDNNATTVGTALLTYANVPQEVCVSIVNGTQALARQVDVAGVAVKPLDGVVAIGTLNTQCTSAANLAISWTLGRG